MIDLNGRRWPAYVGPGKYSLHAKALSLAQVAAISERNGFWIRSYGNRFTTINVEYLEKCSTILKFYISMSSIIFQVVGLLSFRVASEINQTDI